MTLVSSRILAGSRVGGISACSACPENSLAGLWIRRPVPSSPNPFLLPGLEPPGVRFRGSHRRQEGRPGAADGLGEASPCSCQAGKSPWRR